MSQQKRFILKNKKSKEKDKNQKLVATKEGQTPWFKSYLHINKVGVCSGLCPFPFHFKPLLCPI